MSKESKMQDKIEYIEGMAEEYTLNDFLDNEGLEKSDLYDLSMEELDRFEENYREYINEWGI